MSGIIKLAKKDSSNKSIDNIYKSNYKQWKVNLEKQNSIFYVV